MEHFFSLKKLFKNFKSLMIVNKTKVYKFLVNKKEIKVKKLGCKNSCILIIVVLLGKSKA